MGKGEPARVIEGGEGRKKEGRGNPRDRRIQWRRGEDSVDNRSMDIKMREWGWGLEREVMTRGEEVSAEGLGILEGKGRGSERQLKDDRREGIAADSITTGSNNTIENGA